MKKLQYDTIEELNRDIKTRFEIIKPEQAVKIIEDTYEAQSKGWIKQRKQRQSIVKKYVRDMLNGDWDINPQPLVLTDKGYAIDGLHRLLAVVHAKLPIIFNVTRNWPSPESFKIIDTGTPRSVAQLLQIEGVRYATKQAAIARGLTHIVTGGRIKGTLSISEIERITALTNKSLASIVELAIETLTINSYSSEVHAAIVYLHTTQPDEAYSFAEAFYKLNLAANSGPWALKRWYDRMAATKTRGFEQGYAASVAASALRSWVEKNKIEHLRGSKEDLEWLAKSNGKLMNNIKSIIGG